MSPGKVWLVGAGPGDPGLLTLRGAEVLRAADVVLHDALSHPAILEHCRPGAEIRDVGKRGGRQSPSQDWITSELIELARAGQRVVRLKGGDPLLFARGAEEVEALFAAGVPFEIVPGISSPAAASAYAGIPLTHRTISSSVTFVTGTDRNGDTLPQEIWARVAQATDTLCVLMGMRRLPEITAALLAAGLPPSRPAAVVQWASRPEQRVLVSTLGEVARAAAREGLQNPALVIIGEVVRLRDRVSWFERLPLFGRRVLVPRAAAQAVETARAIRERGGEAVLVPAIRIVEPPDPAPLEAALARLEEYDWVLFTSGNGVDRFFDALARRGRDARALGGARLGVIGPGTRSALARRCVVADAMAEEFVGEGLAREVLARGARRVLLCRALVARDALPRLLEGAGARVDVVPVYQTLPPTESDAARLRAVIGDRAVDTVLFTSSSTVLHLTAALGPDAARALSAVTVASIGPITSEAARARGIRVDVAASEYTVSGLLDALARARPGTS